MLSTAVIPVFYVCNESNVIHHLFRHSASSYMTMLRLEFDTCSMHIWRGWWGL